MMTQPIKNPLTFDDPFLAGAFLAGIEWRRRTAFADARKIHFLAATILPGGTLSLLFTEAIPEPLYHATMTEAREWRDQLLFARPPGNDDPTDEIVRQ